MKVLIIFCAMTVLNSMFFIYQSDMNSYIRENTMIKSISEECAAGAGLFYDEKLMGEGYYVFNREEGEKYVRYIIENTFCDTDDIEYEIMYQDSPGTISPGVEVQIAVKGRERFRLSFLEKKQIKRAGYYEYSGY